jgi:hypothetical protein
MVAVESEAEVDRRATGCPGVVDEEPDRVQRCFREQIVMGAQAVDAASGGNAEDHLARDAVYINLLDVAGAAAARRVAFPRLLLQQLAAHLDGVAALAAVEEVGSCQVVLCTITIELLRLVRAFGDERAAVLPEEVVRAVGDQREVVAEVAVAGFDVHLVADRAVPLALVDPAARVRLKDCSAT